MATVRVVHAWGRIGRAICGGPVGVHDLFTSRRERVTCDECLRRWPVAPRLEPAAVIRR